MPSRCCNVATIFAYHANIFSLYSSSLDQFRKRDVVATYCYFIICAILIMCYAMRHFSTQSMHWSCVIPSNTTCPDKHYLYGGNACCIFKEETFTQKLMIFVSVCGGFLTSLLFLTIGVLQCTKFFQGKDRVRVPDRLIEYTCSASQTDEDDPPIECMVVTPV